MIENSHRCEAAVRDKQDLWLLRLVDKRKSWPAVVADCVHTLPRFQRRDREKYSLHRRPNSTSNSRPAVPAESVAPAGYFSEPHLAPFQWFQSWSILGGRRGGPPWPPSSRKGTATEGRPY